MDRFGQAWAGLAMVFAQVWDSCEHVYEADRCKNWEFYCLCRRDVYLHVGVGRVWEGLDIFNFGFHAGVGQVWGGLNQNDAESVHSFVMLRQVANRFGQV